MTDDKTRIALGHPVRAESGDLYIRRPADETLLGKLKEGQDCAVTGPAQLGKTSLLMSTSAALEAAGWTCAYVSCFKYRSLKTTHERLHRVLKDIAQWLRKGLPASERREAPAPAFEEGDDFADALFNLLVDLGPLRSEVGTVIFLDEINYARRLGILLEIESALDELQRRRSELGPRVTFCVAGIDTTAVDAARVDLNDFTRKELEGFSEAFHGESDVVAEALDYVFQRTDGHPFFSCHLLHAIAAFEDLKADDWKNAVDRAEDELVITEDGAARGPIKVAEESFTADAFGLDMARVYKRLLNEGRIPSRDSAAVRDRLILSGTAKNRRGFLETRNRIFERWFTEAWVERFIGQLGRPYAATAALWGDSGRGSALLLTGLALNRAQAWLMTAEDVSLEERAFIDASLARQRRILLYVITGVFVALTLVVGGTFAFLKYDAERQIELELRNRRDSVAAAERAAAMGKSGDLMESSRLAVEASENNSEALSGLDLTSEKAHSPLIIANGTRQELELHVRDLRALVQALQDDNAVKAGELDVLREDVELLTGGRTAAFQELSDRARKAERERKVAQAALDELLEQIVDFPREKARLQKQIEELERARARDQALIIQLEQKMGAKAP